MKYLILALFSVFAFASCNQNNERETTKDINEQEIIEPAKTSNIKIQTIERFGWDKVKNTSADFKISISNLESEYFEIKLSQLSERPGYIATKEEAKSGSFDETFYSSDIQIVSENGETRDAGKYGEIADQKVFKSNADFLNFMSDNNYEMIEQKKNKYGSTEYVFKSK